MLKNLAQAYITKTVC